MGVLEVIRFVRHKGKAEQQTCPHVEEFVRPVEANSDVCVRCVELGDRWVHLRMCLTCGLVGCCDSSKNKHAHRHADETGHPIARSAEPDEDWWWCFIDEDVVGAGPVTERS